LASLNTSVLYSLPSKAGDLGSQGKVNHLLIENSISVGNFKEPGGLLTTRGSGLPPNEELSLSLSLFLVLTSLYFEV
jgi:hypothetical protein